MTEGRKVAAGQAETENGCGGTGVETKACLWLVPVKQQPTEVCSVSGTVGISGLQAGEDVKSIYLIGSLRNPRDSTDRNQAAS